MADQLTIARPYARAGFEFASTSGALNDWSYWLAVSAALVGEPEVEAFIGNPTLDATKRAELFFSLLVSDEAEATASRNLSSYRNFIALLAQKNRLAALPAVKAVFERMKFEHEQVQPVEIRSPYDLTDAQIEKVRASIMKRFNKEVSITVKIDPKLIGGLVVRAGDVVIDGSMSGRLAKLQNTLKS